MNFIENQIKLLNLLSSAYRIREELSKEDFVQLDSIQIVIKQLEDKLEFLTDKINSPTLNLNK